ncbi:uncharacterized protein E0L32_008231 [Thyridium curvatum]|uniref:Uncharacterized protein n=1 Tax=Thyridium curvatum TaxID=1093900 RepID=A0A507AM37_9PEZI|nr:uncharacterized protein E0L32_008231 [Thyridium curvatum]TPX10842.1 hypothetical protein E0L32_008231 [Thyridium curvatum]
MGDLQLPDVGDSAVNANTLASWIHEQPDSLLVQHAETIFGLLLEQASQPRASTRSDRAQLVDWAFRADTAVRLFDYYVEWNETDQHRSMGLILDLLTFLIAHNSAPGIKEDIKKHVLENLISIISGQSTRPLVKSSMGSLHHFLTKDIYTLEDIEQKYRLIQQFPLTTPTLTVWACFVSETLAWQRLQYVSAPAGKCLVTILSLIRKTALDAAQDSTWKSFTTETLQMWLQDGLAQHPEILENVKNYVLTFLFKTDRPASLELLDRLSRFAPTASRDPAALDTAALLQLAALEVGKKVGLVEDPSPIPCEQGSSVIVLEESVLANVLAHPSPDIRALAISLLISSQTTSRPFADSTFGLLRRYLPVYYADPDAKFRNETLSYTKDLIKRLKGTLIVMKRNLGRLESAIAKSENPEPATPQSKFKDKNGEARQKQVTALLSLGVPDLRMLITQHELFYQWFLDFLRQELVSTASYPRHITALKAAAFVLKISRELLGSAHDATDMEAVERIFRDPAWIRSVLDLAMDPFGDVREVSTSILMLLPPDFASIPFTSSGRPDQLSLISIVEEFSHRADVLSARTARADHADGAARIRGVLCVWASGVESRQELFSRTLDLLDEKLSIAEKDLGHAAIENPVHGDFASLGYMWQVLAKEKYSDPDVASLSALQERIVSSCKRVWDMVRHVLCDDSPEGHLPQDMEDVEGLDTKDLLSYSFRAIHESSTTMRIIISSLRFSRVKGLLFPTKKVFEMIGSISFDQLSNLRHRGAFATVSQTYTACCQLSEDPLVRLDNGGETLLRVWYKGALDCIFSQASTTRRSAGIPALITGILAANAQDPSFDMVMKSLGDIAQKPALVSETDGSNLPQVHALNSLKDVFKSSMLGKRAETYLMENLQLAVNCLRSEVWAIRNCGLLLLRSLIDNLFGTGESKAQLETGWDGKTVRISYVKYPKLPDVLASLLKPVRGNLDLDLEKRIAESVFPALDIIRRAGPPASHREELYEYISEYLGSHLWHVREIAARTICSFLIHQDWVAALAQLLERSTGSTNRLHGTLLAVEFVVERLAQLSVDDLSRNIPRLNKVLDDFSQSHIIGSNCSEVHAAFVEVENLLIQHGDNRTSTPARNSLDSVDKYPGAAALLRIQLGIQVAYQTAQSSDADTLKAALDTAIRTDTNTAARMIEEIPAAWNMRQSFDIAARLCELHVSVCLQSDIPEIRAPALDNLVDAMDHLIENKRANLLPSNETLTQLWASLTPADINPTLSHAILRLSGPVMATRCLRAADKTSSAVSTWAAMMSDAGNADNTFDTRFAAVSAVHSFFAALRDTCRQPAYLPVLLVLYDALVDDDEEVRDLAAAAAGHVLGATPLPIQAPDLLAEWLAAHFGGLEAFQAQAVCRIVGGDPGQASGCWTPAEAQLAETMKFDDALFVVEEQNLFIDEVRETERWAGVFAAAAEHGPDSAAVRALRGWTLPGLRVLAKLAESNDGPIGWASKPEVYAICMRIVLGAKVLATAGQSAEAAELLQTFRGMGEKSRLHGGLLAAAEM